MNQRKDILERVKHIMKEQAELKVNCSKLARQLNCDRRTVSRYAEIAKMERNRLGEFIPRKLTVLNTLLRKRSKPQLRQ